MGVRRGRHRSLEDVLCSGQFCTLAVFVIVFHIVIYYMFYYDPCGARQITQTLCDQYADGLAAGSLCYKICREKTIYLESCIKIENGYKVFAFQDMWIKAPEMLEYVEDKGHRHTFPPEGTSIGQFRSHLETFLNAKLGRGNHANLIADLLSFADFNTDEQLSLGEASSLWSLVQIHDFLMMFVFRKAKDHFLQLNGTCGSLYAVEKVPHTYLFLKKDTFFQNMFPSSYLWSEPSWKFRAKVATGLLDFIFTVFEYDGIFYHLCDLSPLKFGYTDHFDIRALDLSLLYSSKWLKRSIKQVSCKTDEDCVFTTECSTICDKTTWQCSSVASRPNLYVACRILRDYVQPDAPQSIQLQLNILLTRCLNLDNHEQGQNLQQMLLLNDLFSLINNQIKYDRDPLL